MKQLNYQLTKQNYSGSGAVSNRLLSGFLSQELYYYIEQVWIKKKIAFVPGKVIGTFEKRALPSQTVAITTILYLRSKL